MPLDPNLLKAGQTDYSWIAQGVKDGTSFAMTKMHLDQQKQLVQQQMAQHQQQKDMIQMQKGMTVIKDIQTAIQEPPGSVRKTMLAAAQQKAQMMGVPISPEVWTAANDKDYQQTMSDALGNAMSQDPDVRDQAMQALSSGGHVTIGTLRTIAGLSSSVGKQQLEAQKAGQQASFQNQSLDLKGQEVGQKRTDTLSGAAAKIETKYGGILDDADEIQSLLDQHTAAGDQAAAQKYTGLMGKERITIQALAANTNIGSGLDRANNMTSKLTKGTLFADKIRNDISNTVDSLKSSAQDKMKAGLSPIIARAQANPAQAQALQDGQIIDTGRLKALGLAGFKPDPDDDDDSDSGSTPPGKTAATPKPTLPGPRSQGEQSYIQKTLASGQANNVPQGKVLAVINKHLAASGMAPLSPTEAQGWQNQFGLNQPAATGGPGQDSDSDSDSDSGSAVPDNSTDSDTEQ